MQITEENWKQYRQQIAKERFPLDALVQYSHGFTSFDHDNFGKVMEITKAGIIYVAKVELKELRRNPVKHPGDYQLGGWREFDPQKITVLEEDPVKFVPQLQHKYHGSVESYDLWWRGPRNSKDNETAGAYDLRIPEIKNGRIRADFGGCA